MKAAILAHLNKCDEPQDPQAIVHFTGLPRLRVETALIEYQRQGKISETGGMYRLTEKQKQEMANA